MAGDKEEKPTPERLRKAREEGQFLSSRGTLTAVQFVTFVWLIGSILPHWAQVVQANVARLLLTAPTALELSSAELTTLLRSLFWQTFMPLLYLGGSIFGVTLAVNLAMTRLGFSPTRLMPKIQNFSPMGRLSSLPMQNLKAVGEALFLIAVLALSVNSFYDDQLNLLLRMPFQGVPVAVAEICTSIHGLLWKAAFIFVLFGALDIAFEYKRHMSRLKMSKQEIRDENKRSEGDPQIKMRIRRLRRELLRRQMMKQVPLATAVIVNPTHFAVAIRYDMETMSSPIVVAKGKNWLALRIRHVATQNEVPIIENPPLARALYDAAEIGSAISPEFYKAIAEVLAYVYKLMGRKLPS
jgi:flagellar biosynthetic protein FlhB